MEISTVGFRRIGAAERPQIDRPVAPRKTRSIVTFSIPVEKGIPCQVPASIHRVCPCFTSSAWILVHRFSFLRASMEVGMPLCGNN